MYRYRIGHIFFISTEYNAATCQIRSLHFIRIIATFQPLAKKVRLDSPQVSSSCIDAISKLRDGLCQIQGVAATAALPPDARVELQEIYLQLGAML